MQKQSKLHRIWRFSVVGLARVFSLLFTLLYIGVVNTQALELAILDCHGSTRAIRKVEPLSKSEVKVDVTDANGEKLDGQELKLKSVDGTQTITAKSVEGTVVFQNVPQGMWVLSSDNPAVFFTAISVSDTLAAGAAIGIASAGLATGGVAVTAGVIEVSDIVQSNNSDPEVTPLPTPIPPIPTPLPPSPTIVPPSNCVACDPEQEAPELPDFFEAVEIQPAPISPSF